MADPSNEAKLIAATKSLRLDSAADEIKRTANANVPFFRLPRELRDEIYDLAALSEELIFHNIALKAGEQPRKVTFVAGEASHACQQFKIEYTAAIERRVKALMAGSDLGGTSLARPASPWREASGKVRLLYSKTQHADGNSTFSIRDVTMPIKCESLCDGWEQKVIFQFRNTDSEVLDTTCSLDIQWKYEKHTSIAYEFPQGSGGLMRQILDTTKAASWKGAIPEYIIWQSYFVRFARENALRD